MKLYLSEGPETSNMTPERIEKLVQLGFVFNPRGLKHENKCSSLPDLRYMLRQAKTKSNTKASSPLFSSTTKQNPGRRSSMVEFPTNNKDKTSYAPF